MISFLFFLLVAQGVVKIIFFLSGNFSYIYDEIIFADVSSQSIRQIFETILFEPHPPGFYLLLKLIPFDPFRAPVFTKISITIVSIGLWIIVLKYLESSLLIKKLKLGLGIALIIGSYSFISFGGVLRPESISLPLFVLFTAVLANTTLNNKLDLKNSIILVSLLLLLLLLIDYIYFFHGFLFLGVAAFVKKKKPLYLSGLLTGAFFFVYFQLFLKFQIINNIGRFTWLSENQSNFLGALSHYVVGIGIINPISLTLICIYLLLVVVSILMGLDKNKQTVVSLAFLYLVIIVIYAKFNFFVRDRYSAIIFLFTSILSGWGLYGLKMSSKAQKLLSGLFFASALTAFIIVNLVWNRGISSIIKVFGDQKTGLIIQHPIAAYIFHRGFNLGEKVVPLSPQVDRNTQYTHLTHEILSKDGKYKNYSLSEISEWLDNTQLDNFIYIAEDRVKTPYYDPERKTLAVLLRNCSPSKVLFRDTVRTVFKVENCLFGNR